MSNDLQKIAFDLALAQLKSQKEDLRAIRNQGSFCAAVSGLIASVFASLYNSSESINLLQDSYLWMGLSIGGWLVVSLFALSILFSMFVMAGWSLCCFEMNPESFLHACRVNENSGTLFERLANEAIGFFRSNEKVIDRTKLLFKLSLIFSWFQIPAWLYLIV